ncbi:MULTISPECIES: general secretion pathway protein GspB [Tenebrionibacter/Tenebrionicola group]|jgi:general secretion pathway protein B|uniref:General secretion pathway protein GspB n=2 Tax=Tenebrionibacter/Tenebrionicola group TaxID=2969848 RepID=A0A8K0V262_9ENTR|nr:MULTISPECIES: general secretion pathway protein GspB [Tenebrionibacter/Tenebrionicola group]MBK4716094.1 general secretion pathway protein GspB [Tenebrionibacter intestinalis]MBV4413175.1 general secretion pathway protein GspB [Tenebrionicola larvae]MBV5095977.1 general secretion pathway protein GspB [Tenebrionicola larvae]
MDTSPPLSAYRIPVWLLTLYALLLFSLGWFAADIWAARDIPRQNERHTVATLHVRKADTAFVSREKPVCHDNVLLALRYSAHVWADSPDQRSVTLNGQQYREGDTLPCGEEVMAIQPAALILVSLGRRLRLDATWDWPGGDTDAIVMRDGDNVW